MEKVLIDTDVILDFFFDREPFSDQAARILSMAESGNIRASVTPVIISNTYDLLRQTASHDKVIRQLRRLLTIVHVLTMSHECVLKALDSGFTDFEDALQNAAAVLAGDVQVIVTRNTRDYRKSTLGVLTPEQYLKKRI
jgi:predicted nucleic acid-binding protein